MPSISPAHVGDHDPPRPERRPSPGRSSSIRRRKAPGPAIVSGARRPTALRPISRNGSASSPTVEESVALGGQISTMRCAVRSVGVGASSRTQAVLRDAATRSWQPETRTSRGPRAFGCRLGLEPQIQLVYQTLSLSDARDEAATVRFDRAESLAGRIGGRLARTWWLGASIDPRPLTAWFRVNSWHEFLGDSRTKISSALGFVPLPSDLGGTWAQMTAGVSAQVSRMVSLYAAANHQIGFDNARHAYDGKLGVRVNW
jgi:hypothetical protein